MMSKKKQSEKGGSSSSSSGLFNIILPSLVAVLVIMQLKNILILLHDRGNSNLQDWINCLLREDKKSHPLYGTPFFRPEVYFYGDIMLQLRFMVVAQWQLRGNAQKLYQAICAIHLFLVVCSDYGLPREQNPFWNYPLLPLAIMNVFDYFIVAADILSPFLIDGFTMYTRWVLPLVYGPPVWFAMSLFFDPNPTGAPIYTLVELSKSQ